MMSILIEQLINITDAIFLGHVGEIELGASALAGIWYLAIYMLGFGFSIGLQVVIARRNGERQYSEQVSLVRRLSWRRQRRLLKAITKHRQANISCLK